MKKVLKKLFFWVFSSCAMPQCLMMYLDFDIYNIYNLQAMAMADIALAAETLLIY